MDTVNAPRTADATLDEQVQALVVTAVAGTRPAEATAPVQRVWLEHRDTETGPYFEVGIAAHGTSEGDMERWWDAADAWLNHSEDHRRVLAAWADAADTTKTRNDDGGWTASWPVTIRRDESGATWVSLADLKAHLSTWHHYDGSDYHGTDVDPDEDGTYGWGTGLHTHSTDHDAWPSSPQAWPHEHAADRTIMLPWVVAYQPSSRAHWDDVAYGALTFATEADARTFADSHHAGMPDAAATITIHPPSQVPWPTTSVDTAADLMEALDDNDAWVAAFPWWGTARAGGDLPAGVHAVAVGEVLDAPALDGSRRRKAMKALRVLDPTLTSAQAAVVIDQANFDLMADAVQQPARHVVSAYVQRTATLPAVAALMRALGVGVSHMQTRGEVQVVAPGGAVWTLTGRWQVYPAGAPDRAVDVADSTNALSVARGLVAAIVGGLATSRDTRQH